MEYLQWLYEVLFLSAIPDGTSVQLALGPLAAVGISLGAQVLGQGLSHILGSKERNIQRRRANREEERRVEALGNLREGISDTRSRSSAALSNADVSTQELYGGELARRIGAVSDRIGSQSASARQAVSRALLSGGGDVTGAGGVTLGRIQEQANSSLAKALGNIQTEIGRRADSYRRFQTGRSDRLLSSSLAAESNLFGSLTGSSQNAERLRILQQQAQKQLGADIGSQAGSVLASALSNPST